MKLLITGGAGYIGSHVIKLLGQSGNFDITIIDNLSTGRKESVLYGKLIEVDLSEDTKIEEIIKKEQFEAILHFAGSLSVSESITNPLKYYTNNTCNTIHLINLCTKYNIQKFIFSSTASVYRSINEKIKETGELCPVNPYGTSKLMSERVLIDTTKVSKTLKYVILRYFNVAGADIEGKIGQHSLVPTHLIKVASQVALGIRKELEVYGTDYNTIDGTCIRDYIHVQDLATTHLQALYYLNKGNISDIFNCGYGHGYSIFDVIKSMKKVSGNDFVVKSSSRRQGDPEILIADNSKISTILNFTPQYDSLDIICKTALDWERKLF